MNLKNIITSAIHNLTKQPYRKYIPYPVNYHEKWLLPPLALFIGIFIVIYGHHRPLWYFLPLLDFWIAAIPSVAAAWLMMGYIVQRTYSLDGKCPWLATWWPRPRRRALLQGWHGLVVPGFAVLLFYAFYFIIRHRPDLFWRYLREDFTFVLLMLFGFNLLLWCYYRLRVDEISDHWNRTRRRKADRDEEVALRKGVEVTPYGERIKDRIALFEPSSQKNKVSAVEFDGKAGVDLRTLIEIEAEVQGHHYYMVHRSLIINRSIILEVRKTKEAVHIVLDTPRKGRWCG